MTYNQVKRLCPDYTEIRAGEYVLLLQNGVIAWAFLKAYINKPNYTGGQHLCQAWVTEIQKSYS